MDAMSLIIEPNSNKWDQLEELFPVCYDKDKKET